MARKLTWRERLARKSPRLAKQARRWVRSAADGGRPVSRPIFVFGAQRSGTRVPLVALDRHPDVMTFNEGSAPYFDGVLLRDLDEVDRRLARSPFPWVVLKPICESHRAAELVERFPGSLAIWIYRRWPDTVASAVAKWSSGVEAVRLLAEHPHDGAGWRAGGLSQARLDLVREVYRPEMSRPAADALLWYLRSSLFFDLGLSARPDILLVKYEDLVVDPQRHFPGLFGFLGIPFEPAYVSDVYSSSVKPRRSPEGVPDRVLKLCDDLQSRLDEHYERRV